VVCYYNSRTSHCSTIAVIFKLPAVLDHTVH
jgi:hypothetical protein